MRTETTRAARYRGDQFADRLHLRLFVATTCTLGAEWDATNVRSSYWRFYANTDEGAFLTIRPDNGAVYRYPLQVGRLYFIPAGVPFDCGMSPGANVRHFYIHFDVLGLPLVSLRALFDRPVCLPENTGLSEGVTRLIHLLQERDRDDLTLPCHLKAFLYEALACHLESLSGDERERGLKRATDVEPVLPALEYIEAHLAAPLTNEILAATCYWSADYFLRRFRACVGVSPGEYVQERRVEEAARRLLFTDESLEAIAEACGFSNRYYFTRVFSNRLKMAPATYRRTLRV